MRFSIRFLIIYSVWGRASTLSSLTPVMKTCFMAGSVLSAVAPRHSGRVGTVLRCISCSPSRSISSIMIRRMSCCSSSCLGRNTSPVPYLPFSGTGMPCNKINSWGICSMIPAPSPFLPTSAPRWRMFSNTCRALSTSS